jgi:hypothetical protein
MIITEPLVLGKKTEAQLVRKCNFRVHNSRTEDPILILLNPVHTLTSYVLEFSLILSFHFHLDILSGTFLAGFQTTSLCRPYFPSPHLCFMPHSSHPLDVIILIMFGAPQYAVIFTFLLLFLSLV